MKRKEIIKKVLTYIFDSVLFFIAAFIVGMLAKTVGNIDFLAWRFALGSTIGWMLFKVIKKIINLINWKI